MFKKTILIILTAFTLTAAGCGGRGGSGGDTPGETTYTVGGTVSGLSGTVVLQNNGTDDLTISQDGAFTFGTAVADGGSYAVTLKTQPSGQLCTVTNEAGTISGTNVTNVSVTCIAPASGSLDTTFGSGGKVITQIGSGNDEALAIAVQSDGKIIAAGSWENSSGDEEFALVRYNPDGTLDTAFGGDGRVTTEVDVNGSCVRAVAIQADGKIVAAGDAGSSDFFAVARYNTDGSLDATFDTDGIAKTALGNMVFFGAMAIQSDGKIVVAGSSYNGTGFDFALVRYNPDGTADLTFDGDGIVMTSVGSTDYARAMAIQPDGKIIVAGRWHNGTNYDIALARYNPDGSLDTTFDADGIATTAIGSYDDDANAMAIQSDGKIVVAGDFSNGTNENIALVRYNPDGTRDTTFGADGIATTAIGSGNAYAYAIALQSDGKMLVVGYAYNGTNPEFALVRYNTDGSLDTAFDGDGIVTTVIGGIYDFAFSMAVQCDGRIVVAGSSHNGTDRDIALVRYWP